MAEHDPPVDPSPEAPGPPPRPDPISTEEPEPTTAPPPTYSKAPFWIGLLLLLAFAGAGVGVVAALSQPELCDGSTFRSDRFGYCLVVPQGWKAHGGGTLGEIPADLIQAPGEVGTVYIQSVSIDEGQTLEDFADSVRSLNEQAGYQLGAITETAIAGVPALRWDFVTGAEGGVPMQMREIVFIDGENGWRVQMADAKPIFGATASTVDAMLETWVFA